MGCFHSKSASRPAKSPASSSAKTPPAPAPASAPAPAKTPAPSPAPASTRAPAPAKTPAPAPAQTPAPAPPKPTIQIWRSEHPDAEPVRSDLLKAYDEAPRRDMYQFNYQAEGPITLSNGQKCIFYKPGVY